MLSEKIKQDWLNRSSKDYVHRRVRSINPTDDYNPDKPYSAQVLRIDGNAKILNSEILVSRLARKFSMDIVSTMIGDSSKIRVKLGESSYTNGSVISLSADSLISENLSFNAKIDVLCGYAVHESAHIIYTDMEMFTKYLKGIKDENEKKIKKALFNILEDERIEILVGEDFVGYANYLAATKRFVFSIGNTETVKDSLEKVQDTRKLNKIINNFISVVRFPQSIDDEFIEGESKLFSDILDILTPYPIKCIDVSNACDAVYKLLLPYIEEAESNEEHKGAGNNPSDSLDADGTPSDSSVSELIETLAEMLSSSTFEEAGGLDNLSDEDKRKVSTLFDRVSEPLHSTSEKDSELYVRSVGNFTGIVNFVTEPINNREEYAYIAGKVGPQVAKLRSTLLAMRRNNPYLFTGMYEGTFDEDRIVDARIGVKNVYKDSFTMRTKGASICLLLDESGSMGGSVTELKKIAVLYERALAAIPEIDYYCYGHSTAGLEDDTEIYTYYEPGRFGDRFRLMNIDARLQNRDGHAIAACVDRIRKNTQEPIILFVVSDGAPSAPMPEGIDQVEATRDAVIDAEKRGVFVVQIAIKPHIESSKMFKYYVEFTDMNSLVKDMSDLMLKLTNKLIGVERIKIEF